VSVPALLTLAITLAATILLISNWLRPDLVALLVLVALGVSGLVTPEQALDGFSGQAVITILGISIIAEGLGQTGIAYRLGQQMKRLAGGGETRLLIVVMLTGACLSLFMNNIAAMAVLLPATLGVARQSRIPPTRLLMPLAYGVIVGGMATLFTTSNLIASSALRDAGLPPFGVLDFLPVGLPMVAIAVVYMLTIGRRTLPQDGGERDAGRPVLLRADLLEAYRMAESLHEVRVLPGSAMAGVSLQEGGWRSAVGLNVLAIQRRHRLISSPEPGMLVREGDVIYAQGEPDRDRLAACGLQLEQKPPVAQINGQADAIVEIVLAPHSLRVGRTLREIGFRERFHLTVLALWRAGKPVHIGFADMPLRAGDGLLVQGPVGSLGLLRRERDLIVLAEDDQAIARPGRAWLAALIGLAALAVAILGWLPIALVALAAAAAMVLTGCLSMDEAYHAIHWRSIFLIAGMWPLSVAIQSSGLSDALVGGLLAASAQASPLLLTALLLLVTMLLTNVMAGQAAAPIVLAPIGLAIARATGADARMLLMAIALGCSLAFPTPIGHPVNVLAMSSGGYTFRDFFRAGWPLTLIIFAAILLGLRLFWGL